MEFPEKSGEIAQPVAITLAPSASNARGSFFGQSGASKVGETLRKPPGCSENLVWPILSFSQHSVELLIHPR